MRNVVNILDSTNATQLKINADGSINTDINNVTIVTNPNENKPELAVSLKAHVCAENTTSTPLLANATFTGTYQDTLDYGSIFVGIITDKNSATNGLKVQWSADGINVTQDDTFTILANKGKVFTFSPANRYFKITYINGTQNQTLFNIQTILRRLPIKPSSHRINDSIVAEDDAELVKAVLTGENPAGTFVNFQSTTQGNFKVSLEELENGVSDDSNSKLRVSPYCIDEFGAVARLLGDSVFQGALITIPPEHHEIHCGDSYEATYTADLGNGATATFLIVVPNEAGTGQTQKQYHAKINIDTEAESLITIYEAPTTTGNGTPISIFNRNRNSVYVDYLGYFISPTVTDNGTQLFTKRVGSARQFGGAAGRENEIILKNNTKYLITILNATATNNYYNIELDYYVHPGV